jgi:hypothetical protein
METYPNLILPFYRALRQDVIELLPDVDVADSFTAIEDWISIDPYGTIRRISTLGKRMETSLVTNEKLVIDDLFETEDGTSLPHLFYEMFTVLFHDSGLPRYTLYEYLEGYSEPSNGANFVFLLRQILLCFSKLTDVEPEINVLDEVATFADRIQEKPNIRVQSDVLAFARYLLRQVLCDGDYDQLHPSLDQWDTIPYGCHGPGAVAEGETGVQKWSFRSISGLKTDCYQYYPGREVSKSYLSLPEREATARLAVVPKDFRGHRLICIEPKEMMFHQQGLMRVLYELVHSSMWTRKAINFFDQSHSQRLSSSYNMATVDLSDASDRVSKTLCRMLLPKSVWRLLSKYRSRSIDLSEWAGGLTFSKVETYETAFTMGNALCFPVETLVFWALSLATMLASITSLKEFKSLSLQLQNRMLRRCPLRVFGDDIIVPMRFHSAVCDTLLDAGMVVNFAKTCSDSLVREACGSWYFAGYDVRITRFKFHQLSGTHVWCSFADNAKELFANGLHHAANSVLLLIAEMHTAPLGFNGFPGQRRLGEGYRWNSDLQRLEYRAPLLSNEDGHMRIPGEKGLYAFFTKQATFAVLHGDPCVKWSWIPLVQNRRLD